MLLAVRKGITRPGAMQRSIEGISTKVMNERVNKMVRYGILTRTAWPEVPPRVEYTLTEFGERFVEILDRIESLQAAIDDAAQ